MSGNGTKLDRQTFSVVFMTAISNLCFKSLASEFLHFFIQNEEELFWLNPLDDINEFAFDKEMCEWGTSSLTEARRLMAKACKGALSISQQTQLRAGKFLS